MSELQHQQSPLQNSLSASVFAETLKSAQAPFSFFITSKKNNSIESVFKKVEFRVNKAEPAGAIKCLDISLDNGAWYQVRNINAQIGARLFETIERGQSLVATSSISIEQLLHEIHALILSDPSLRILDITKITHSIILQGKFFEFGSIPALAQERIAQSLIQADKAAFVFYNLKLFEQKLPQVVQLLLDLRSKSMRQALIDSLTEQGTHGLAAFEELPFEVAKVLLLANLKYTAVVEAETDTIQNILSNLSKFSASTRAQIHRFLMQSLSDDFLSGSELIRIYSKYFREQPDWMALLINSLSDAVDHSPPRALARCIGEFPRDEWDCILDSLIERGRASAIRDLPRSAINQYGAQNLAWKLLDAGAVQEFSHTFLPLLSGLANNIAQKIIDASASKEVLLHAKSFEPFDSVTLNKLIDRGHTFELLKNPQDYRWDKRTLLRAVDLAVAEKGVGFVLTKLSSLGEQCLGYLEDKYHLLSYQNDIGVESESIYAEYVTRARRSAIEAAAFSRELKELASTVASSQACPLEVASHPFYKTVVRAVYPDHRSLHLPEFEDFNVAPNPPPILEVEQVEEHNQPIAQNEAPQDEDEAAAQFPIELLQEIAAELGAEADEFFPEPHTTHVTGNFHPNSLDRTLHLQGFKIQPQYRIRLSEGVKMQLKDGERLNAFAVREVEDPIREVQSELAKVKFRKEQMREKLTEVLGQIEQLPRGLSTAEEKIYALMLESLSGRVGAQELKKVLLMYHFSVVEDIKAYLDGTHDRAHESRNPEYVYLLYLREFFSDALRDTAGSIVKAAEGSTRIQSLLPRYHQPMLDAIERSKKRALLNKTQTEKLGATPKLLQSIAAVLHDKELPSQAKERAVAGMIRSEQKKIAAFLSRIGSDSIDVDDVHVGHFRVENHLKDVSKESVIGLQEKHVKMYLADVLASTFQAEIELIDGEIRRFKPEDGARINSMVIDGVITKNEPSFLARGVAGVCVAGDRMQWDQAHYFQMVLQDPATKRCEGLIMLHHFHFASGRVLVASFQPTSTYLHKVNEEELFKGILDQLIEFAKANRFSYVTCSTNRQIRTNRTGGPFEMAMIQRIREVNKRIQLGRQEPFSKSYSYMLRDLDVLWQRR